MLVERLEHALERSKLDRRVHALIFIDVDRFKAINDSLGHGTGDDLLVAIGARLKQAIRGRDLLARFGGDEFVILLEGVTGVDEAVSAAHRICAAVEEPVVLSDGYEIVASLSVGIALTEPGRSADDVLRDADVAMYRAKGRGGSYELFDKERMGTRSSERLDLEAALRKGIERDELEVFYQPLVSVNDLRIIGAEALLRWRHPTEGLISPGRFIPVAEESGLILPLGRFVLENACAQVGAIKERCGVTLPINVNLSPRQFQHTGLLDDVATILIRSGVPSNLIVFELTETMVMDDLAGAREIMKKLDRLGVRLAIDDFGTGHSSLGYLKQFPVDKVKVDRIFVQGVGTDPVDAAIVRAVVDLADAMQITAVAEGVETKEQLAGLKMVGCHEAQGYYFAKPLPVVEFEALLEMRFGTGGLGDQLIAGAQAR
jgi:diguanylate cyclase (GGDEF)-like protein